MLQPATARWPAPNVTSAGRRITREWGRMALTGKLRTVTLKLSLAQEALASTVRGRTNDNSR